VFWALSVPIIRSTLFHSLSAMK